MSISTIHIQKIINSISRYYYSCGMKPTEEQIMKDLSLYFSSNSASLPIRVPSGIFAENFVASELNMNNMTSKVIANLDLLYESTAEQVEKSLELTTFLRSRLERLNIKRRLLLSQIDEYLFANENTDGYFYSFLDTFPNLDYVDRSLTSAFINVTDGAVTLPINTDTTQVIYGSSVVGVRPAYFVDGAEVSSGIERSPFAGCLDGLTNTNWSVEIPTSQQSEVVCILELEINAPIISSIEYTPYGTTPVQVYVEVAGSNREFEPFGSIKDGADKMVFNSSATPIKYLRITLRKSKYDFIRQIDNSVNYHYIIGAKDIVMIGKNYVNNSVFVSKPIAISKDLSTSHALDAVAIKVEEEVSDFASIDYFVALDNGDQNSTLYDFDWKRISPYVDQNGAENMVVSFNGSTNISKYIRREPGRGDLKILNEDPNNPDSRLRNPFRKDGIDLYRICDFGSEKPIISTLKMEEGVDSLKVYYTGYDENALSLNFWADYVNGKKNSESIYSRIDTANGFFWGGDIGENFKSVYMETYLYCEENQKAGIQKFIKTDANSQLWALRVYLNGSQVGDLPVGKNELDIRWGFKAGLNHICITALIPRAGTSAYPNEGSIELMQDNSLSDYGSVRLSNWSYLDLFQLMNNVNPDVDAFSTFNDGDKIQIVSRKKPSNNFRLTYSTATSRTNQKIRVRADLNRPENDPSISPVLHSYRVRFRYSS
jgi:hypothetical protein